MKGQNNISRGRSFAGVYDYLMDHDDPEHIGGTLSAETRDGIIHEFASVANLRKDIDKPVWHESLRLPEGDHLGNETWEAIAHEFMDRMDWKPGSQYTIEKHNKPDGEHIHIVANRVHPDGSIYYGQNENLKATRVIQQLEKDFNLTITKGPDLENDKVKRPDKASPKKNEMEKALRTGEAPDRLKLQELVAGAMAGKPTVREFVERLNDAGVEAVPNVAKTGKMNGFSFAIKGGEAPFSGSKLGDKYKWASLLKNGLDYSPERDTDFLQELRNDWKNRQSEINDRAASEAAARKDQGRDHAGGADRDAEPERNSNSGRPQESDAGHRGLNERPQEDGRNPDKAGQQREEGSRISHVRSGNEDRPGSQNVEHQNPTDRSPGSDSSVRHGRDSVPAVAASTEPEREGSRGVVQQHQSRESEDRARRDSLSALKALTQRVKDLAAPVIQKGIDWKDRTTKAVADQLNQMRCKTYEIGYFDRSKKLMMNREMDRDQVIKSIPKMKQMNARGNDIYIRPGKDENSGLVLLDDIDKHTVEQLIEDGRQPALVVETSHKNVQAWVRIGAEVDDETRLEASRALAKEYDADVGSVDARHYGRLAGFTNRKQEHQDEYGRQPYCLLSRDMFRPDDALTVTPKLDDDRQKAKVRVRESRRQAEVERRRDFIREKEIFPMLSYDVKRLPDDEYYRYKYQQLEKVFGKDFDASRADYRLAKDMIKDGDKTQEQIKEIIKENSPDILNRKHGHVDQYVDKTVEKAANEVSRERSEAAKNQRSRSNDGPTR